MLEGFTCPELTAECWAEQVKITMVTNLTISSTVLNFCGIPDDQNKKKWHYFNTLGKPK